MRRVLFVCYANAIRSQMAEAFARTYGADVMQPCSAGLAPAMQVMPETRALLREKNITLTEAVPKPLSTWAGVTFDLVVNMSGRPLPKGAVKGPVESWAVPDPIGRGEKEYRAACEQIEQLVMRLILTFRMAVQQKV